MGVVRVHRAGGVVSIVLRGIPLVRGISCAGCSQVRRVGTVQRPVGARQETGAFTPPSSRPFAEGLSRREGRALSAGRGTGSLGEGFAGRGYLKDDRFFVVRGGRVRGGRQRTLSHRAPSLRRAERCGASDEGTAHTPYRAVPGAQCPAVRKGTPLWLQEAFWRTRPRADDGSAGVKTQARTNQASGAEPPVDDRRAVRDRRVTRRRPGVNKEKIKGIGRGEGDSRIFSEFTQGKR